MDAPRQPPFFFDPMTGAEHSFPDTGTEMGWLIDTLVATVETFPDWSLAGGPQAGLGVRLSVLAHARGRMARIGIAASGRTFILEALPDPSGWVRVAVFLDEAEIFVGFMDHPYEEYAIWPANAPLPKKGAEAPGRMGKHLWWLTLSAAAWPVLAGLAEEGWFGAEVPDR